MLVVETIAKIRRAYFQEKKPIKQICRELRVSRNTVRKVVRSGATEFNYERSTQPQPRIGPWKEQLDEILAANARKPRRERLTLIRIFEELQSRGYDGGYDAVRRYAASWSREQKKVSAAAYVPLTFAPGEAFQFDWSHEIAVIDGATTTVKVAHIRLCHSRMPFVRAYPRETQEMVFDAHDRAFAFFGGACSRGIYDNMKTAVETVFVGRDRAYNRRFQQMSGHYLFDPVACTPASGWEKGQVENQVSFIRRRLFVPRPAFPSYSEFNSWLQDSCISLAMSQPHPELRDRTIWEVFQDERASLVPYAGAFDGFHALSASVSKTCLVRFDKNRYSVDCRAVGRPVEIRAYAERIEIWQDGRIVGQHVRSFGRDKAIYDPFHYIPVLLRKPGALRNGAPFREWELPPSIRQIQKKLACMPNGDRQMVQILSMISSDGLEAIEGACEEALTVGVASASVVLNILARHREPPITPGIVTPDALRLTCRPVADCSRYDSLRGVMNGKIAGSGRDGPAEALWDEGSL